MPAWPQRRTRFSWNCILTVRWCILVLVERCLPEMNLLCIISWLQLFCKKYRLFTRINTDFLSEYTYSSSKYYNLHVVYSIIFSRFIDLRKDFHRSRNLQRKLKFLCYNIYSCKTSKIEIIVVFPRASFTL